MLKVIKSILATFIIGIMLILPSNTCRADTRTIFDNKIKFTVTYTAGFNAARYTLGFANSEDGKLKFKLFDSSGTEILVPLSNAKLYYGFDLIILDSTGKEYLNEQFLKGSSLESFWNSIKNLKMSYGDKIRIEIGSYSKYGVGILGHINSNLDGTDFSTDLDTVNGVYQLRIEKDGLHSEYINQVKIPNGEYIIETAENANRVIESKGIMVKTEEYSALNNQKFIFEYDDVRKAYKIKGNNGVLSWSYKNGADVINYQDNNSNDQFWYLEDAGNGKYRLINASNIYKVLNLDADNSNISVTERRNNIKQEFKIIKSNEKLSITDGEWKIVSKLNNNKVLNLHIGGISPSNVTIWDNANVTQQKWKFEYNASKNAFRIRNSYNNGSLAWNPPSSNVYALGGGEVNSQYWILEYVGDGYYIFKNYHNPNMVLDLYNSDTGNASNIQVFKRNNGDNQKFKLVR